MIQFAIKPLKLNNLFSKHSQQHGRIGSNHLLLYLKKMETERSGGLLKVSQLLIFQNQNRIPTSIILVYQMEAMYLLPSTSQSALINTGVQGFDVLTNFKVAATLNKRICKVFVSCGGRGWAGITLRTIIECNNSTHEA